MSSQNENMDANQFCSDFISFLNISAAKVEQMFEKVTNANNQVAEKMLETSLLFDPKDLLMLEELKDIVKETEQNLKPGQELKTEFGRALQSIQTTPVADFQKMLEEISNL